MNDSILTSVKKLLGIPEDYVQFDADIIMHINSVFVVLYELGLGTSIFSIMDKTSTWADYLESTGFPELNLVQSYMYMKVRLLFDPPTNSSALQAMQNLASEYEFRISIIVDPSSTSKEVNDSNG